MSFKNDIEELTGALKSHLLDARLIAAESLGKIGNPLTVSPLIEVLDDEESEVRAQAALALATESLQKIKTAGKIGETYHI